jgi:hypothetical protein
MSLVVSTDLVYRPSRAPHVFGRGPSGDRRRAAAADFTRLGHWPRAVSPVPAMTFIRRRSSPCRQRKTREVGRSARTRGGTRDKARRRIVVQWSLENVVRALALRRDFSRATTYHVNRGRSRASPQMGDRRWKLGSVSDNICFATQGHNQGSNAGLRWP